MITRIGIAFVLATTLLASVAVAGYKENQQVAISTFARHVNGSLGSARNSIDSVQQIGCILTSDGAGWAYCWAKDATGKYVGCGSSAPGIMEAVKTITSDSFLSLDWDTAGTCTQLHVYQYSSFEPKK